MHQGATPAPQTFEHPHSRTRPLIARSSRDREGIVVSHVCAMSMPCSRRIATAPSLRRSRLIVHATQGTRFTRFPSAPNNRVSRSVDQVYDTTAMEVVDSSLQGYNATVFAYGQTVRMPCERIPRRTVRMNSVTHFNQPPRLRTFGRLSFVLDACGGWWPASSSVASFSLFSYCSRSGS